MTCSAPNLQKSEIKEFMCSIMSPRCFVFEYALLDWKVSQINASYTVQSLGKIKRLNQRKKNGVLCTLIFQNLAA